MANKTNIAAAGLILGISVLTALVAWQGIGVVGTAVGSIGWGMVVVPLFFLPFLR